MLKKLCDNIKEILNSSAFITKLKREESEESIVRIIELSPNLSENEIGDFLIFNAEKYIGLSANEIKITYKILKTPLEINKFVVEVTATKRKEKQNLKKKIFKILLLGFAIILSWHVFLVYKSTSAITEQHLLNSTLIKIKQNYSLLESQKSHLLQLESFFAEIKNLDQKAKYNAELFTEIGKIIPAKMYLTQLNTNNEIIILNGKALSLENVSLLIQNISKSKLLKNPELQEIKNDTYDNTLKNFTVIANKKF